MEVLTT